MDGVSDLEIDVEDVAELVLRFAGGVLGSIHLDMVQATATRTCRIIGTEGTIEWDGVNRSARLFAADRKPWTDLYAPAVDFDRNTMYLDQMRHFLDCVGGRATPRVSGDDGLRALEIALAAKESAAGGRSVELPR